MPSTLVTTIGGTTSNSYVTLAEANTFFDDQLNVSDWTSATDDDKTRALLMAKDRLEQEVYTGWQVDYDQALAWPRSGAMDVHGDTYENDEIPQPVKDAQCWQALEYLKEDLNADTGLEGFKHVQVGSLNVTPRHAREAGELSANVHRELAHLLMTPSRSNVRVVRG